MSVAGRIVRFAVSLNFLRPVIVVAVSIQPRFARWLAKKLGYGEIMVDQIIAARHPPEWKIEADPKAIEHWAVLLADRPPGALP